MPLILPGNVASATASTTYDVDNSCRFNDGDSAYMTRAFDAAQTSTSIFTISVWVKRGILGTRQSIFAAYDGSSEAGDDLEFETDDTLSYNGSGSSSSKLNTTSAVFRDPSAWYNIIVARNSGASGAANQVKIYVNGVLQTLSANGGCDTSQFLRNGLNSRIGSNQSGGDYFVDMYMAEFVAIDGQMLDHTSFGEFDSDSPTIWKPKDPSGLTFGDNGFYLDFEDSGDLGDDESGNTNDFTESNLDATDQATDTPTNNFATLNPLDNYYGGATFAEGNCKVTTSANSVSTSTIGVSKGKWYFEAKMTNISSMSAVIGITDAPQLASDAELGTTSTQWAMYGDSSSNLLGNGGWSYWGTAYTEGDIMGVALDMDNNRLYIAKDNTWMASADPTDGTNAIDITTNTGLMFPAVGAYGNALYWEVNFGNPSYANSSDAADADGYGAFEYAPPTGYYAICTKNLAEYG